MALYKTEGLIINKRDFMESDKIITILSPEQGKIEAVAKGSRKISSKKSSTLEIFNLGHFSIAEGKNLDILTEMKINEMYDFKDHVDLNFIFYFCELVEKITIPSIEYEHFFSEVLSFRKAFSQYRNLSILKLQILVLEEIGALPDLRNCVESGENLKEKRFYSELRTGYISSKFANSSDIQIHDRIIKTQIFLSENEIDNSKRLTINDEDFWTIFRIQNRWIENQIEREIKSFNIIQKVLK